MGIQAMFEMSDEDSEMSLSAKGILPDTRDLGILPDTRDLGILPDTRDLGILPDTRDDKI